MRTVLLAAMLALFLAVPSQAGWQDPAKGGNWDYTFITAPATNTEVSGVATIEGVSGNNNTTYPAPDPLMGSSESNPIQSDPPGDHTAEGTDIGNIWIPMDTGSMFQISMRLHTLRQSYLSGQETEYLVEFNHTAYDTRYAVGAADFAVIGYSGDSATSCSSSVDNTHEYPVRVCHHWEYFLYGVAEDGSLCYIADIVGAYVSAGDGGIVTYNLQYTDLTQAGPAADCASMDLTGPGAAVGEFVDQFHGHVDVYAGPTTGGLASAGGDASDGTSKTWELGGGGLLKTPSLPVGPWSPVDIYVDSLLIVSLATNKTGNWSVGIDFSGLPAPTGGKFRVTAVYNTSSDEIFLKLPPVAAVVGAVGGSKVTSGGGDGGTSTDTDLDGWEDDLDDCAARAADDCDPDWDGDGVRNGVDNCPVTSNRFQEDTDRDGVGDACNDFFDRDRDEWSDRLDICPEDADPGQADRDRDGIGDACDDDRDGDGVPNSEDLYPDLATSWRDLDGDGIPDDKDADIDGDGFLNSVEQVAGTDPLDKDSYPEDAPVEVKRDGRLVDASSSVPMALGSIGVLVALVGVGALLFFLLRREDA